MENNIKVNIWTEELEKKLNQNTVIDLFSHDYIHLRMANRQYEEIFNLLMQGKTIPMANLDLVNKTLFQAINEKENEDNQNMRVSIFTTDDGVTQNKKISYLLSNNYSLYLTFGLLEYFDDNKMTIKSAPLVIVPIKIEYIDDKKFYQISNINHEIFLNELLIKRILDSKRIDLSFPLENNFSLIEYLTYVATKVRNYHFSVNNGCFILPLNLDEYYFYDDFVHHKEKISSLPLVKSISYLNSEFFNLNKPTASRLNNNYLSLLDLDNDEYKIVRRMNLRENLIIRSNYEKNLKHLFTNTIYNYLLNNKTILLTYDGEREHKQLLSYLDDSNLQPYYLDLKTTETNKKLLINHLLNLDKLDFDTKLLDKNKIDETVDTFYLLKNNFKKIINSLRTNNAPLNISINRAIFEYYDLSNFPLLNIEIPNIESIDENKLKDLLEAINTFAISVDNLKCNYKDHPFYGFNDLTLTQDQYIELKDKIIALSGEFNLAYDAFDKLNDKYLFPKVETLKEMKCVLNILSLLDNCLKIDRRLFEIEDYNDAIDKLKYHNELYQKSINVRDKIIAIYEDKVFLINHEELKTQLQNKPLKKKIIKNYRQYFMKKVKVDETILTHLSSELEEYYDLNHKVNDFIEQNNQFDSYYSDGIYNIELFEKQINIIKNFKNNCNYLKLQGKDYSFKNLEVFTEDNLEEVKVNHRTCQIAFNHLLGYVLFIQKYFDKNIVDLANTPLSTLEEKINKASKNFSSINNYLDFYLTSKKINRLIPNISQELLIYGQSNTYIPMFLRTFYRQLATTLIKINPVFKDYNDASFNLSIENYLDYNQNRQEIIKTFVKNNIKNKFNANNAIIRSSETPYLNSLLNDELKILPLNQILSQSKNTVLTLFPIIVIDINEISYLLANDNYYFDVNIIFPSENLNTKIGLLSSYRAEQNIIFDSKIYDEEFDDRTLLYNDESFIISSYKALAPINYFSSSYKENVLVGNKIDTSFKKYLIERLKNENFLITQDYNTKHGIIDILVKVPNSTRPTAISIDRLSYYSLESAIDSIKISKEKIESLNFAYYSLITSVFFLNEEQEYKKLIDFIIKHTVQERNIKVVKKTKPLIDVLFEEYVNPREFYLSIQDKANRSINDIMMEFFEKCCPISKDEAIASTRESSISAIADLSLQRKIHISNNFIFVNNKDISFKRVSRDSDKSRNLDSISNEEIAAGILKITSQRALTIDSMIKLILFALGLRKMNHNQYFRLQNIIGDLLEDNKLFIKDDKLYIEDPNH